MSQPVVLIIEDDPIALRVMTAILRTSYHVVPCADPRLVVQTMSAFEVDIVVMDLNLPHVPGEVLLPQLLVDYPDLPVVVVTGTQDATTAVRLVKKGAFDYLVKPVDPKSLVTAVGRAVALRRANQPVQADPVGPQRPELFTGMVTQSRSMLTIFQYIEAVATSPNPVLVTGETGTGKELVAQAIHAASGRSGACVACNVGGLDDGLLSDALFGHRKGAFTGAVHDRAGLVDRAAGGTLFLDEIGDLPVASQVKLLRLLQEGEYLPVGVDVPERARIRVVAATSLDLDERIADGRFRRDLYYRLCGHRIHLPPLRERRDDIPMLVAHFAALSCVAMGVAPLRIPNEVLDLLTAHPFLGNVRELQALVHDAVSRRKGGAVALEPFRRLRHQADHHVGLAPHVLSFPAQLPTLEEVAEQLIAEAIRRCDGNLSAAARQLGITRQALHQRSRRYEQRRDI